MYKEIQFTDIPEVLILKPQVFKDSRGYFFESFNSLNFIKTTNHLIKFIQDNESYSTKNVMRGLHFQKMPYAQSKLVRCVKGAILDFALDIREGSPTYGKHVAVELNEDNKYQLFIPVGFAHGFLTLSDEAIVNYKVDDYYNKDSEGGILITDPELGLELPEGFDISNALLSDKDKVYPKFSEFETPFKIVKQKIIKKEDLKI